MSHLTPVSRSAGNHGGPAHSSTAPKAAPQAIALKAMVDGIVLKILSYVPSAALALKGVHRQFIVAGRISVSHQAAEMFNSVRSGGSDLFEALADPETRNAMRQLFKALADQETQHVMRLSRASQIVNVEARIKAEARACVVAHVSIVRCVRSTGAFYWPNSILTFKELTTEPESQEVQQAQNPALKKIWDNVRRSFKGMDDSEIGWDYEPVQKIRAWMFETPSRLNWTHRLRLSELELSCVPKEIALFRNLQVLELHRNNLTFLQADLLQGLTELTEIRLSDNRLTSIPEDFFRGSPMLKHILLNDNQLTFLPPKLLEGLTHLRRCQKITFRAA